MQQHVAVGVSDEPERVGNAHAAESDEVTLAEAVHVVAVADTHKENALKKSGRDSTGLAP
ncbi:hypothetical protein D3C72_2536870 [compost metagenome]